MMKPLYCLVALAFALILASCATSSEPIAGTINGQIIPMDQFAVSHRGHYENFYIINKRAPRMEEINEILKLTWRDITKHMILQQQFRRYNITSSLQEALDTLHVNPPTYIKESPRFQKNGVFDRALFVQTLKYDQSEEIAAVIRQYRDYYVPIAKLKQKLISKELLTSKDKKLITNALNAVVDLELIYLDPKSKEVSIKDDDIQFYYDTHASDFTLEPQYSVAYSYLKLEPSSEDVAICHAYADSLFQLLQDGADPEELVKIPTSKQRQVSWEQSGFIKIDQIDEQLFAGLSGIKATEFLPPISLESSTMIYRLDQITKSMISYSFLKVPHLPGSQTINKDKARAQQSAKLLGTIGYQATQDELDLSFEIQKNILFDSQRSRDIYGNLNAKELVKIVRQGYVPEPVFSYSQSAWLLMQVIDVMPLTRKPIAEVYDEIYKIISIEKAYEYALKDAEQAIKNASFTSLKNQDIAQSQMLVEQSVNHIEPGLLDLDILFESILGKLKNQEAQIYQKDGFIIIPVIQKIKYQKQKIDQQGLEQFFEKSLPNDWFDQWMEGQIKKAKVVYKV